MPWQRARLCGCAAKPAEDAARVPGNAHHFDAIFAKIRGDFPWRPLIVITTLSMNVDKIVVIRQVPIGMEWNMHMLLSGFATPMVQFGVMGIAVAMVASFLMRP